LIFKTRGTCSQAIDLEVEGGIIKRCRFADGCTGNLEALSRLVEGKPAAEVAAMLQGIRCQNGTSCPDQLAKALKRCLEDRE
jgi:uncharacterized protein (TIGR03905 family)